MKTGYLKGLLLIAMAVPLGAVLFEGLIGWAPTWRAWLGEEAAFSGVEFAILQHLPKYMMGMYVVAVLALASPVALVIGRGRRRSGR